MNFGRGDLNFFSYLINRLRGSYRYLTNFNFIKKSKMNVSHHYDISDDLYYWFQAYRSESPRFSAILRKICAKNAENNSTSWLVKFPSPCCTMVGVTIIYLIHAFHDYPTTILRPSCHINDYLTPMGYTSYDHHPTIDYPAYDYRTSRLPPCSVV